MGKWCHIGCECTLHQAAWVYKFQTLVSHVFFIGITCNMHWYHMCSLLWYHTTFPIIIAWVLHGLIMYPVMPILRFTRPISASWLLDFWLFLAYTVSWSHFVSQLGGLARNLLATLHACHKGSLNIIYPTWFYSKTVSLRKALFLDKSWIYTMAAIGVVT